MALSTNEIHNFFDLAVRKYPASVSLCRQMMIASLSPHRKRVYECVYDAGKRGTTAREISDKLQSSIHGTDNALLELDRLDLVYRTEKNDKHGLYYQYFTEPMK